MQFWNELEGQNIDGVYPLRRLVRSTGRSAWFETETGEPQSTPATISLIEALTDADEVTARLLAAQTLRHPNLVRIMKVGHAKLDDTLFVYAVMEHIEQSLSDVLQSQVLSPEEGREVAEAMVAALTAIHQRGMSHGLVEADSVLAIEETVKLRSDCLQTSGTTQAEDVAGIGTTLFHAFTQRRALTATDAQINRIPAPFAEIVRNSFAGRWTLAQIANALKRTSPVTQPGVTAPIAETEPIAAPAPTAETEPIAAPAPAAAPPPPKPEPIVVKVPEKAPPIAYRPAAPAVAAVAVAKPLPLESEEQDKQQPTRGVAKRRPFVLYGALAVVVLAIIGWLFLRPSSKPSPANGTATQAAASADPQDEKPAADKPAPAPAAGHQLKSLSSASVPIVKPPASAAPSNGRSVWRVVAYTYKHQQQAADMVAEISGKHSDLDASVFSPGGKNSVYLVTLGGAMDRTQAMKMRDKAIRLGMPDDTYVQNFSE
jgi:hypothetical protein